MSAGINEGKLWVFGGQDEDNNKLNDLWCFDPSAASWSQIKSKAGDYCPLPRSGHSTVTYGSKMYIFGGILELTKELNDFIVYDFITKKFMSSDEANLNCFGTNSPTRMHEELEDTSMVSPMKRAGTIKVDTSPNRLGGSIKLRSTLNKSSAAKALGKLSVTIGANETTVVKGELLTPTSVSMKNSFIVKNSDDSFVSYGKAMDKRLKKHIGVDTINTAANKSALVRGNKPTPRDGHSATVDSKGFMFVFGGDRHHMPFNDLYMIKLE